MKTIGMALLLGLALAQQSAVAQPESKAQLKKAHTSKVAKKASAKKNAKAETADKGHLSTDVNFGDSVLRGEYQAPAEALAKVENEKGFGDLIGVRKHFKDRLATAADQE